MDELEQEIIDWHIIQYAIYSHRLYHKINGCHIYGSEQERQYLLDMQEHHELQYRELTSSDDLVVQIDSIQKKKS